MGLNTSSPPVVLGAASDPSRPPHPPRHDRETAAPPRRRALLRRLLSPSAVSVTSLAAGIGLLAQGLAVSTATSSYGHATSLFWLGQLLPFLLFTCVLVLGDCTTRERTFVVAVVGLVPTVSYRAGDLMQFIGFDELLHQRTADDLISGSGLFAANPLLPVSPYYPGLESLTGVILRLTGAPLLLTAFVVVALCRMLLVLGLFSVARSVTGSEFRGSLVVLCYASCPQFFAFNSQFAYQTLGLTLGLGALILLRQAQLATGREAQALFGAAIACFAATVVTHHVTSWLVLIFLWLWILGSPRGPRRRTLLKGALVGLALLVAWSAAISDRLLAYFGPVVGQAVQGLAQSLGGTAQRRLFADSSGVQTPLPERFALVGYAVIWTATAVLTGFVLLREAFRSRNAASAVLGVLALAFPLTLAGRFAPAAAELGDRASTFLFFPLALAVAGVVERHVLSRPVPWRFPLIPPARVLGVLVALTVAFFGGLVLGAGPEWSRLPGSYLVGADHRSADAETRAAVAWAGDHLPAGTRLIADRYPAAMLAGETRLFPVMKPDGPLEPASLYFADAWGEAQADTVRGLAVRYLYVDTRLAQALPRYQYYFYPGETPVLRRLTATELGKFAEVPALRPVYRHGPVTIYDTAALGVPDRRSGWWGHREPLAAWADVVIGVTLGVGASLVRRRALPLAVRFARSAGFVGTSVTAMSLLVFLGVILLGLRILPGPWLASSLVLTLTTIEVARRRSRWAGWPRPLAVPPIAVPPIDPYVVLAGVFAVLGTVLAWRTAWLLDVVQVQQVLAAAGSGGGP